MSSVNDRIMRWRRPPRLPLLILNVRSVTQPTATWSDGAPAYLELNHLSRRMFAAKLNAFVLLNISLCAEYMMTYLEERSAQNN